MPFSNFAIDLASLPKQEDAVLQPVDPRYKKVQLWNWLLFWGVLLLAWIAISLLPKLSISWMVTLLVLAGMVVLALVHRYFQQLSFRYRSFALREHDIIYQHGWFIRHREICPVNRVQHCNISASIIERKYGLATLHLFTAGSNGADMTIRGLTAEQATQLKERFVTQTAQHGEQ